MHRSLLLNLEMPSLIHDRLSRRGFLGASLGLGSVLLVGSPRDAEASPLLGFVFRTAVTALVGAVVTHYANKYVLGALSNSTPEPAVRGSDTHSKFSSEYVLRGAQMPSTKTDFGYWIEVDGVPRSDDREHVRSFKDLNSYEIRRVLHEQGEYGCVLHPCDYRTTPGNADQLRFEDVCRKNYGADPGKLHLDYSRPFTAPAIKQAGRTLLAFGVTSRTDPNQKDLLISV